MALEMGDIQVNPLAQQMQMPAQQPGFFQKLAQMWQDPNVRAAVGQTGAGLMRSPSYGQSGWDVAGGALGVGLSTLDQLRQRDKAEALAAQERADKQAQQTTQNKIAERQVAATERNANTSELNVKGDQENKAKELDRAERALNEAIRHNKSSEEIDRLRAEADKIRASAYSSTTTRTPAEVEKLNRLKKYAMDKLGMDETNADKYAFDYLQTAKGKSPRQLVIESFQKKAQTWMEQQFDPTAQPTPEMREQWKKQAIEEVRVAEEAGADISNTRGVVTRPGATPASPAASTAPPSTPSAQPPSAAPAQATGPNQATVRSIEAWKLKNATPEQIKILIAAGGENPATYGY